MRKKEVIRRKTRNKDNKKTGKHTEKQREGKRNKGEKSEVKERE